MKLQKLQKIPMFRIPHDHKRARQMIKENNYREQHAKEEEQRLLVPHDHKRAGQMIKENNY